MPHRCRPLRRPTYLIETPLDPAQGRRRDGGRAILRHLHARRRARPMSCASAARATVERDRGACAGCTRRACRTPGSSGKGTGGPWRRARVTVSFPVANIGANLATLAATVAGNLYDLGEVTGLRLDVDRAARRITARASSCRGTASPARAQLTGVAHGAAGRHDHQAECRPERRGDRRARRASCARPALDFIKDDEVCADPVHAPLAERIPRRDGRACARIRTAPASTVMVAFNITDETDAMRRHADLVAREGGTCVMASLNWCGFSAIADAAALDRSRASTGTATASARSRAIRCSASASRPIRRSGASPASITCMFTACRASSRRRDEEVVDVGARLPDAADRRRRRPRDAGLLLRPMGRHRAGDLRGDRHRPTCSSCPAAASWRIPAGRRPACVSIRAGLGGGGGRRAARPTRARRIANCAQALETSSADAHERMSATARRALSAGTATISPARPTRSRPRRERGLRALLFLRVPTPEQLAAAGAARRDRHRGRGALDGAGRDGERARRRSARFFADAGRRAPALQDAARPSTARRMSAASARRCASLRPLRSRIRSCRSSADSPISGATACSATCSRRPAPAARCIASTAIRP